MAWKRIILLSFILVIIGVAAGWGIVFKTESKPAVTEIKTQMPDVSPEVREKAFGLLGEVLAESDALKAKSNKLELRFFAADLLWERDEAKARNMFRAVFEDDDVCSCQGVSILTVAARDAKLAYQFRREPGIFKFFIKQYPAEALELAKTDFDRNFDGFFPSYGDDDGILSRLSLFYEQDSAKGAEFARYILTRLKNKQIKVYAASNSSNYSMPAPIIPQANVNYANYPAANSYDPAANRPANRSTNSYKGMTNSAMNKMSNSLPDSPFSYSNSNYAPVRVNNIDFSQVRRFFEAALPAEEGVKKGQVPMLSEGELGELAKLMVNALLTTRKFGSYEVQGTYDALKKYAPAEMARLERTLTPKRLKEIRQPRIDFRLPDFPMNEPATEKLPVPPNETTEEKAEREFVDNIHYILTGFNHCNIETDAVTFARFKNKAKYPDMIEYFEEYLPAATARTGNIGELRAFVENEKDNAQKIKLLSLAADAVTAQSDKRALGQLLIDSKIAVPQNYKNASEFKVMMNYAGVLSATSPAESFKYLEAQLKSVNETINSAGAVAEFSEHDSQENAELRFSKMREQLARNSPLTFQMIKKLAHSDFERTVKLADRFTRPEVRLFVRWHIANSLLNKNAPDEEAQFYEIEICG